MSQQIRWMLAVVAGLILAGAAWESRRAVAGPMIPEAAKLPDEVLCLSGMQEVRVHAENVPIILSHIGLTREKIEGMVRDQLKKARFSPDGGETAPVLVVNMMAIQDSDSPGVVTLVAFLEVHQDVRVTRLDKPMNLPTSTLFSLKVTTPDKIEGPTGRILADAVDQFIHAVDAATRAG